MEPDFHTVQNSETNNLLRILCKNFPPKFTYYKINRFKCIIKWHLEYSHCFKTTPLSSSKIFNTPKENSVLFK